jgi:hypothetical protein
MEILVAIDRLDDAIHEARVVPLTDQVRIEKDRLHDAVAAIRSEADRTLGGDPTGPVYEAIERLELIAAGARPVPLTGQVRVDTIEVHEQLDVLRQLLPEALGERRGEPSPWDPVVDAIDATDALAREAGRTVTGRLKVDAQALRHAAGRLRTTAVQNLGPPDAQTAPFYAVVDDIEALARGEGTLKLPRDRLWDLLQRLYETAGRAASTEEL